MRSPLRLPPSARNPVSLVGIALATAMAIVFVPLVLLDALGYFDNPYVGLLVFVTIPAVFVVGLLLVPIGAWWRSRRPSAPGADDWPVIDLRIPRQRTLFAAVLSLTIVNVVIVSMAAYGGVHYMDSSAFCGQVCHATMEPEYVARDVWPHAKVECTACHVGPGVGSFVEAKLTGARQLVHLVTNRVPKPIPAPVRAIGDTRDTCEGCHRRAPRAPERVRVIRDYAGDEVNTEGVTTLRMKIGTPAGPGIHRHIGLDIEYVTVDARREVIPFVRVVDPSGAVREYRAEGATDAEIASGTRRRMDCTDCHNRPAHTFFYTAERAVDDALASGRIPRELPFVRREAVEAVKGEYGDRAAALALIARRLEEFYPARGADPRLVDQAVAGTRDVWMRNVFPGMNVQWGSYPNHLGHVETPGCFRCHDDTHKGAAGSVISQECELCHTFE